MKSNFFYTLFLFYFFCTANLIGQNLEINSDKINYNDANKITILEGNVRVNDKKANKLFSEYAEYNKLDEIIESKGKTRILTSAGYELIGTDITFDSKNNLIQSNDNAQIRDVDGNKIFLDMFSYSTLTNIFFSKGNIKIIDILNNNYEFSEIYIDEKKKKIVGSDVKAFLKGSALENSKSDPRFFANTMNFSANNTEFDKGIFTYCKNRKNEKCPPWTLQSKKIKHDLASKTIFYENVVLKIYDFPVFFSPKFSHPDPTVSRRSGLLSPSLANNSTMGSGIKIPYFLDMGNDRDLTFSPIIYATDKPLFLAEYRQDFKNSFLMVDSGFTQSDKEVKLKKNIGKKNSGTKGHFFSNFNMSLINSNKENSNLEINTEKVSGNNYFETHKIQTALVPVKKNIMKNYISYNYQNEDLYFGLTPGIYINTQKTGNSRYEYNFPLAVEKKIMSNEKFGFLDLESNLEISNYDVNTQTNFLINDFTWKSKKWLNKFGFENHFETLTKSVVYETTNSVGPKFKDDTANYELASAVGYFTKLNLYKNNFSNKKFHSLTPKLLLRYAPGHSRDTHGGSFNYGNLFDLKKTPDRDVLEDGLSTSIGFEYKKNKLDDKNNIAQEELSFSIGQVVSAKENMDIPASTSLDQRFSDIVGEANYNINENISLNYNFNLDQSYKTFNYNDIGLDFDNKRVKFNVSYLQERNHIGDDGYIKSGLDYKFNNSTELAFSTKRNLLTDSSEFYDLSYNYINDCLRAGVGYRREFYTDRDIEPRESLMFTISIIPLSDAMSAPLTY